MQKFRNSLINISNWIKSKNAIAISKVLSKISFRNFMRSHQRFQSNFKRRPKAKNLNAGITSFFDMSQSKTSSTLFKVIKKKEYPKAIVSKQVHPIS